MTISYAPFMLSSKIAIGNLVFEIWKFLDKTEYSVFFFDFIALVSKCLCKVVIDLADCKVPLQSAIDLADFIFV